jgi:hypothetical protein
MSIVGNITLVLVTLPVFYCLQRFIEYRLDTTQIKKQIRVHAKSTPTPNIHLRI